MASIRAICLPDADDWDGDREILVPDSMSNEAAMALAKKVIDEFREEWNDEGDFDELESRLVETGFIGLNWIGKMPWRGSGPAEVYETPGAED